jgi:hypothetical protein
VGDDVLTVDEGAAGEPAEKPPADASTSYIDRYAHLFDNDEATGESPAASARTEASSPPHEESAPASPDHEHEKSMEEYMAKLMERLRGSSAVDIARPTVPVDDEADNPLGEELTDVDEETNAPLDAAEMKAMPRTLAAERGTDMEALRALANQSARHAIGVHAAGKMRRNARTRFIVALLAGVTGLFFALRAPGLESVESLTAAVAILASLYWSQQMFHALVSAVRVGAFDEPEDDDFAAVDGGGVSLPIDVRR